MSALNGLASDKISAPSAARRRLAFCGDATADCSVWAAAVSAWRAARVVSTTASGLPDSAVARLSLCIAPVRAGLLSIFSDNAARSRSSVPRGGVSGGRTVCGAAVPPPAPFSSRCTDRRTACSTARSSRCTIRRMAPSCGAPSVSCAATCGWVSVCSCAGTPLGTAAASACSSARCLRKRSWSGSRMLPPRGCPFSAPLIPLDAAKPGCSSCQRGDQPSPAGAAVLHETGVSGVSARPVCPYAAVCRARPAPARRACRTAAAACLPMGARNGFPAAVRPACGVSVNLPSGRAACRAFSAAATA